MKNTVMHICLLAACVGLDSQLYALPSHGSPMQEHIAFVSALGDDKKPKTADDDDKKNKKAKAEKKKRGQQILSVAAVLFHVNQKS